MQTVISKWRICKERFKPCSEYDLAFLVAENGSASRHQRSVSSSVLFHSDHGGGYPETEQASLVSTTLQLRITSEKK